MADAFVCVAMTDRAESAVDADDVKDVNDAIDADVASADVDAVELQLPPAALDGGSFEAFFAEHHATLVRALSLALGDSELGRDAASEGFVRALQRWNRVSNYDNAPGWVYRVGLNWARSRRRKTVREVSARPAERSFAAAEPDFALATALRSLSLEHRAVVVGRYFLDWSEAEVAAALDIAPGTAKSRLSRALDRLQAELGGAETPSAGSRTVGGAT